MKRMLINAIDPEESRIAVVEDGVLQELHVELANREAYLGNIYKGKVVNIEPSIGAAFVAFGGRVNGFLHVSDVLPAYGRPEFMLEDVIEGRARVDVDDGPESMQQALSDDDDDEDDSMDEAGDDASPRPGAGKAKAKKAGRDAHEPGRGPVERHADHEGSDDDSSDDGDHQSVVQLGDFEDSDDSSHDSHAEDDDADGHDREDHDGDDDDGHDHGGCDHDHDHDHDGDGDDDDDDETVEEPTIEAVDEVEVVDRASDDDDDDDDDRRRGHFGFGHGLDDERPLAMAAADPGEEGGGGDDGPASAAANASNHASTEGAAMEGSVAGASEGDGVGPRRRRSRSRRSRSRKFADRPDGEPSVGEESAEHGDSEAMPPAQHDAEHTVSGDRGPSDDDGDASRGNADGNSSDGNSSHGVAVVARPAVDGEVREPSGRKKRGRRGGGKDRPGRDQGRDQVVRDPIVRDPAVGVPVVRGPGPKDQSPRVPGKDGNSTAHDRRVPRANRPTIDQLLKKGQEVVVQITKEGIGTKGPTLTTYVSLPGRCLVLMPSLPKCGVSRKIEDGRERRRLKRIVKELDETGSGGIGFIVRTAGINKSLEDVQRDRDYLKKIWEMVAQRLKVTKAPALLYQESDLVLKAMRDQFTPDIADVVVDSEDVYMRIRDFAEKLMPVMADRIKRHSVTTPLFHSFGIEKDVEALYEPKVDLSNGASIVIDQAEALVAIDVNSGKYKAGGHGSDETAYRTNLEAIPEIVRQLRLRDLGGLIIIDFIDMSMEKHRRNVERKIIDALRGDRARIKVGRISPFGMMEITRQRVGPGLKRTVFMQCPHCKGAGWSRTVQSKALSVLREVRALINLKGYSMLQVFVAPAVSDYLVNYKRRAVLEVEDAVGKSIVFRPEASYPIDVVHYRFLTGDGNEARIAIPAGLGVKA